MSGSCAVPSVAMRKGARCGGLESCTAATAARSRWRALAGCATKPKLAARPVAAGRGRAAAQVRRVEGGRDRRRREPARPARPRLAGSAGRGQEEQPAATSAARASCSSRASALPRPAPTPGSYYCRLIKLGKATRQGQVVRKLQAVLLLCRGRGRPVHHRQADRQPAARGRLWEDDDATALHLPRQPRAGRRGRARGLWREPQARHGRRARADRAVPLAAGDPVAAEHVQARRVRADPGRPTSPNERRRAGLLADPAEARAILVACGARRANRSLIRRCWRCSAIAFTRPKMRALCKVLSVVDEEAEARGEPELAVLVVRQSDGLPGQGWWIERRARAWLCRAVGRARGGEADPQAAGAGVRVLGGTRG